MSSPATRRDDWETPNWLFEKLHAEYKFTIDASAHARNHKLERYWSIADDGLAQDWTGERVWCNPPYGKGLNRWVSKARGSGALVAMLLPVRSESAWWCEDAIAASEIRFIRGRVHFKLDRLPAGGPGGNRPVFSSAVVIFGNGPGTRLSTFSTPGIEARERQLCAIAPNTAEDAK